MCVTVSAINFGVFIFSTEKPEHLAIKFASSSSTPSQSQIYFPSLQTCGFCTFHIHLTLEQHSSELPRSIYMRIFFFN